MRYTILLIIAISCFTNAVAQTNNFSFAFQQPVNQQDHASPGLDNITPPEHNEIINVNAFQLKDPRSRDPEKVSTNLLIVGGSFLFAGAALVGVGFIVENNTINQHSPGVYYMMGGALIGGIGFNLAGAGAIIKLVNHQVKRRGL